MNLLSGLPDCEKLIKVLMGKGFRQGLRSTDAPKRVRSRAFNGLTMHVTLLKFEKSCINKRFARCPRL